MSKLCLNSCGNGTVRNKNKMELQRDGTEWGGRREINERDETKRRKQCSTWNGRKRDKAEQNMNNAVVRNGTVKQ